MSYPVSDTDPHRRSVPTQTSTPDALPNGPRDTPVSLVSRYRGKSDVAVPSVCRLRAGVADRV